MPQNVIIRLENALGAPARVVELSARVNLETDHLCLPASLVSRLKLNSYGTRRLQSSDGKTVECRYVGPVMIQVGRARAFAGAVELGSEVIIGNMVLAQLGLRIHPMSGALISDSSAFRIATLSAAADQFHFR